MYIVWKFNTFLAVVAGQFLFFFIFNPSSPSTTLWGIIFTSTKSIKQHRDLMVDFYVKVLFTTRANIYLSILLNFE